MYRNNNNNNNNNINNGSQVLRRFVQQAQSYNRCMFPNNSLLSINKQSQNVDDRITEQILFCQNGIDNINISSKKTNSYSVSCLNKNL